MYGRSRPAQQNNLKQVVMTQLKSCFVCVLETHDVWDRPKLREALMLLEDKGTRLSGIKSFASLLFMYKSTRNKRFNELQSIFEISNGQEAFIPARSFIPTKYLPCTLHFSEYHASSVCA